MIKGLDAPISDMYLSESIDDERPVDDFYKKLLIEEVSHPGRLFPAMQQKFFTDIDSVTPLHICLTYDLGFHRKYLVDFATRNEQKLLDMAPQQYAPPLSGTDPQKADVFLQLLVARDSLGHFDIATQGSLYQSFIFDTEAAYKRLSEGEKRSPRRWLELIYLEKLSHGITALPPFSDVLALGNVGINILPEKELFLINCLNQPFDTDKVEQELFEYLGWVNGHRFFMSEWTYMPDPAIYEALCTIIPRLKIGQNNGALQATLLFGLKSLLSSRLHVDRGDFVWEPITDLAPLTGSIKVPVIDTS